jgi:hypothetical protein
MVKWVMILKAGLAVAAMIGIIIASIIVRPHRVDERPWQASMEVDAERQVQATFRQNGGRFSVSLTGSAVAVVSESLAGARALEIELYRADDPTLDVHQPWDGRPLVVPLVKPGRWRVRIHGEMSGVRGTLFDQVIEAPSISGGGRT